MKKLAYIFCIAILGVACSKEAVSEIEYVKTIDVPENMVKLSITVPREPETRATMSGKQLSFAAEDKIAVIGTLDNKTSIEELVVESISETEITFSAAIDPDMEIGDYAYYPVSIANKDNPTLINWPSSFDGTKVQMPMMAKIDVSNNKAIFRHLGAMLKVNLTNAPADVKTLEFKTTNPFVGSYNVTFSGNSVYSVTANSVSGNTETLSVNLKGSTPITTYYVPIPAGTYAQFQLGMKEGDYYHKQRTSALEADLTPAIGNMVNLGDFPYDVDQIEEWYLASDLTNWNTGYKYNRFIKIGANTYYLNSFNPSGNPYWDLKDGDGNKWCVSSNVTAWNGAITKVDKTFKREGADNHTFWIRLDYNDGTSTWNYSSGNWTSDSDRAWSSGYVKLNITGLGTYSLSRARDDYASNYSWMYENLEITTNAQYSFKFVLSWDGTSEHAAESGVSGSLDLTDACTYGQFEWAGANAMTAQLTPGKYNVYLDLADLNFMFVKQPKSN